MKTKLGWILGLTIGIYAFLLSGCSNNGSSSTNASSCSAGQVYSSTYGCLTQAGCPTGMGNYNGSCVAATANNCPIGTVSSTYGCLQQASCPTGMGMYNNQCVVATGSQTSYYNNSCQASCPVGYTSTSYGCYPQGACPSCYGYANGYCFQ